ncbi:MAG TPA: aminodeoxychorismate synthase component I [Novosphingobium sp.]|nr:aminodeoxychorismate synthase component I [Novosphingobium sp.]
MADPTLPYRGQTPAGSASTGACAPLRAGEPFVLLDDARLEAEAGQGTARLYRAPIEVVIARRPEEVAPALDRIEALHRAGHALAGHVAYEAGLALEGRLAPLARAQCGANGPLVWIGAFAGWHEIPAADVPAWLAAQAGASIAPGIGPLLPQMSPGTYGAAIGQVLDAITAGDIYQANFTFPLAGGWRGDPLAIYAGLRSAGGGAHGGIVHDGQSWLVSLSPELFVECDGEAIRAKPMKGTRPRGATPSQDAAIAAELAACAKDRAENLMILDLMRNDISRVAVPGSVRVDAPFAIETYPTVHQMVSTVTARMAPGKGPVDLIRALFPCGSVTGAPKIRAMQIIDATEIAPRGPYCGSIGHIDPVAPDAQTSGRAAFNVAIRTLRLVPEGDGGAGLAGRAVLGVGSAIVADSQPMDEWRECLVKGGFVHQPASGNGIARFDLIETMAFSPEEGIPLLELHLERMRDSAAALGFAFDRHGVRNAIHALCFAQESAGRLRLMLARSGAASLEIGPVPGAIGADGPVPCVVLPLPVDPGDWRLAHKTSDRFFYDAGLRAARGAGAREALFIRDDGRLTEGCFTNLFVRRDGQLLTPPATLGLLPGVLRRSLLEAGAAREADLTLDDLEDGFLIGNGLRGLMPARLLDLP